MKKITVTEEELKEIKQNSWEDGFMQGEAKQAIIEIQARERFLSEIRKDICSGCAYKPKPKKN